MLTTYRRLFDLLDARERRRFWLLLAMIFAMGLLDMVGVASILPFLAVLANPQVIHENPWLATAYDTFGFTASHSFLIFLGTVTFCFVIAGQLFKAVTSYALLRFAKLREFTIGSRLLEGYLRQPYEWFLNRHSADLGKTILSEVDKVIQGVMIPGLRLLSHGVLVILLAGLLVALNPVAALGSALLIGGTYGAIFAAVRGFLQRIGEDRVRANLERYRLAQEALGGIKEVKLLGLEERYLERFRIPSARFARREAASAAVSETPRYLLEAVVFGGMLLLLLVMLATAEGKLDAVLPMIGVFAFAGARLFPSVQAVYAGFTALRFNRPALDTLHADLTTQKLHHRGPGACAPMRLNKRLQLIDVHYTYPGAQRAALKGLSLCIEANTTVGIVGTTGAGKTTAVDVILGLLAPQAGEVLIDGVPLGPHNARAWQRSLGYVPQQIFLADDTVAANIAFGVPESEIDMAAVERAARIAELHHFVTRELADGYYTRVGERGVRLSGGQRQRIGIARALYHDPDVLIFDEATSALDNVTEKAVIDAVHNLAHAKTIIMIAHRLSTMSICDRIFTIESGRLQDDSGSRQFVTAPTSIHPK